MRDKINNKLFELSIVCQRNENKFANWVMFAVERHILSGRASVEFEKKFCNLEFENLNDLVLYCLDGDDLSYVEIIERAKEYLKGE